MKALHTIIILILGLIIIFGLLSIIVARSQEDTWICSGGGWVAHGKPTAAMPDRPCPPSK